MRIVLPCRSRWLLLRPDGKAPGGEDLNGMGRFAGSGELGEYLSDHRCEFESVAGKVAGNTHRRKLRVDPKDEMLVGRHGVEAGLRFQDLAGERRKAGVERADHCCEVRLMDFTIDGFRRAHDMAPMNRCFHTTVCAVDSRKSIARKTIIG